MRIEIVWRHHGQAIVRFPKTKLAYIFAAANATESTTSCRSQEDVKNDR